MERQEEEAGSAATEMAPHHAAGFTRKAGLPAESEDQKCTWAPGASPLMRTSSFPSDVCLPSMIDTDVPFGRSKRTLPLGSKSGRTVIGLECSLIIEGKHTSDGKLLVR